jgi:hypothetical protein
MTSTYEKPTISIGINTHSNETHEDRKSTLCVSSMQALPSYFYNSKMRLNRQPSNYYTDDFEELDEEEQRKHSQHQHEQQQSQHQQSQHEYHPLERGKMEAESSRKSSLSSTTTANSVSSSESSSSSTSSQTSATGSKASNSTFSIDSSTLALRKNLKVQKRVTNRQQSTFLIHKFKAKYINWFCKQCSKKIDTKSFIGFLWKRSMGQNLILSYFLQSKHFFRKIQLICYSLEPKLI